jgi:hypothetical protein
MELYASILAALITAQLFRAVLLSVASVLIGKYLRCTEHSGPISAWIRSTLSVY